MTSRSNLLPAPSWLSRSCALPILVAVCLATSVPSYSQSHNQDQRKGGKTSVEARLDEAAAKAAPDAALTPITKAPITDSPAAKKQWRAYLQKTFGKNVQLTSRRAATKAEAAALAKSIMKVRPGTNWQWQLSGKIDTAVNADVFDVDLFDAPIRTINTLKAKGRRVICYFSAGSYEDWRPDAKSFPDALKGKKLAGWNEKWLDIREVAKLRYIMGRRMDLAEQKGCDAVEPDNVDGYTNDTGFRLTARDQIRFNKMLAIEAHKRGLAIGLKNDGEQARILEPWFDFAVVEQCFEYRFCDRYLSFVKAGKAVLGVEYHVPAKTFCPVANKLGMDFLYKKMELGAYRISCRDFKDRFE